MGQTQQASRGKSVHSAFTAGLNARSESKRSGRRDPYAEDKRLRCQSPREVTSQPVTGEALSDWAGLQSAILLSYLILSYRAAGRAGEPPLYDA